MHNNYFFLKRISETLSEKLKGFQFGEIFSQNKDELIVGLYNESKSFYIKANLSSQFTCLSFSEEYARAKRNSIDLFESLIDCGVLSVEVAQNDRCLLLKTEKFTFLFKLYGNRSNAILFDENKAVSLFNNNFKNDKDLNLETDFDKHLDLSFENFQKNISNPQKILPTIGKEDFTFIFQKAFEIEDTKKAFELFTIKINELEKSPIYIDQDQTPPKLRLYKHGENAQSFTDPLEAINFFYHQYAKVFFLHQKKQLFLSDKKKQIKKVQNYIIKAKSKLEEIRNRNSYQQIADIIMANMHTIKPGQESVELFDFYNNKNLIITLKKELPLQKNAENLYRKSKNQKVEIEKLAQNIAAKEKELTQLQLDLEKIETEDQLKNLKQFDPKTNASKKEKELPYHLLIDGEHQVLVGKNARKNDELTFKVAAKNDLWLHVKDAPGSHVVIRQIAGKQIPSSTIEKAASLAAWFSKRKTEGLVPVTYTERKYVRKTKDLLAGQVIVEKEKTILVEPKNWLLKN